MEGRATKRAAYALGDHGRVHTYVDPTAWGNHLWTPRFGLVMRRPGRHDAVTEPSQLAAIARSDPGSTRLATGSTHGKRCTPVSRRFWVRVPRGPPHCYPLSDAVSWLSPRRDRQRYEWPCGVVVGVRASSRSATESRSSSNRPAYTPNVITAERWPNICRIEDVLTPDI